MAKGSGSSNGSQYSHRVITPELQACYPDQGIVTAYMHWATQTTYADPYFHLAAILPCLAYEANARNFRWGGNRHFRLVTSIVAGSGAAKSTAISRAREFFAQWLDRYYQTQARDPFLQASGSINGLVISAIENHWYSNVNATLPIWYLDELSQLMNQGEATNVLNQLWDGGNYEMHYRYMQRAKSPNKLKNPVFMGMFASTEEGLASVLRSDQFSNGLFSRFLWFFGDPPPTESVRLRYSKWPELKETVLDSWCQWAQQLDAQRIMNGSGYEPQVIDTSDIGLDLIEELLLREVVEHVGRSHIGGVMVRLLEYTESIAALYALSRWSTVVDREDAFRAVNLIRWCQRGISELSRRLSNVEPVRHAARVEGVVKGSGTAGCFKKDLYRRTGLSKRLLEEAIGELVDRDAIAIIPQGPGPSGGRPGLLFVHMDHYVQHLAQQQQQVH